ncbi:hypothetical protein Q7P37_006025 [Cladosporium fusiforme]
MATTLTRTAETIELQAPSPPESSARPSHMRRSAQPPPFRPSLENDGNLITETSGDVSLTKSNIQTFLTIFTISFVSFLGSFSTGSITVGLPDIARDISLDRSLYLWPSSVYGLTSGAALLIAGSIADIVGPRPVELLGIFFLGVFSLACGFATSGEQLVAFRALQGIALAMFLPASVALVAGAVPSGRPRNFAFACLGFSQPLGFATGLVVSGVMIQRVGWRSAFYWTGSAILCTSIAATWALPKLIAREPVTAITICKKICNDIDWIGVLISCGGLAILAYTLAILSADLTSIRSAATASLLAVSIALLISFPIWMHYRERARKPALIPNKLWKNATFTSTCIMVALSNGTANSFELFSSLYFQEVQNASTIATSLYLLPNLTVGVIIAVLVGTAVHRVPARWLVSGSAIICAVSPLIMAVLDPTWNYWKLAFWAQITAPFSVDVLYTVGLIIVSDTFPEDTQALAGAVFSTVGQIGTSLALGSCQVVALGVQGREQGGGHGVPSGDQDTGSLLKGYRASFWTMFAYMVTCVFVAIIGLRKVGKVGLKRD